MRRHNAVLSMVLSALFCLAPVSGTFAAQKLDLDSLTQTALKENPGVQAKKQAYEALKAKVIDAWLLADPQFGADVEGQRRLFNFQSRSDVEISAQQEIPFPTKIFLKGWIAAKEADVAYQNYREEERSIIWHMEEPYYNLFLAKKTISVLEENKNLLDQLLKTLKARYEAGQASQVDWLRIQIELSKTEIEIFNWKEKEKLQEAHFSHLINQPLDTHYDIDVEISVVNLQESPHFYEKKAIEKRPELRAIRLLSEQKGMERDLTNQEWLPDITLRYEGRRFKGEGDFRENDTFIGVTMPVWSLLKGIGGVWRGASAEAKSAELEAQKMEYETRLAVHEAYSKVRASENALLLYENSILPQAKQAVEVGLSSYEVGKIDFVSLIDTEKTLKESELAYQMALVNYAEGLADLRRVVGDDLGLGVERKVA